MVVKQTDLKGLKLVGRGKVRDIYDLGDKLLIVASDRISAFDVIMDDPIPDKGKVLTAISKFWFDKLEHIIPNHLVTTDTAELPDEARVHADVLGGRFMLVKKAIPLPVECIVRGYITGSGWADYQKTGTIAGLELPQGLVESDRLEEPIFTPSTKAEQGLHDENISFDQMAGIVGAETAARVRDASLAIYRFARDLAAEKGIIIADTKFEFGLHGGELLLIDEVLTPDSSRFWPADQYQPGRSQPSFDKQYLRDYLAGLDWDKTPPPPILPEEIVNQTKVRYLEALEKLTGHGGF